MWQTYIPNLVLVYECIDSLDIASFPVAPPGPVLRERFWKFIDTDNKNEKLNVNKNEKFSQYCVSKMYKFVK